jgi:hypothetical protein
MDGIGKMHIVEGGHVTPAGLNGAVTLQHILERALRVRR